FGASGAILVTRIYSQLIRDTGGSWASGATALAMICIGGGIGLTAMFEATQLSLSAEGADRQAAARL
ncbi:hypothetical protein ACC795_36665, partial [Rhizobium ruizarguesonis]